ncbi:hypothetical protein Q3G72_020821 [Acer saccharum]|nr:hypothetical protein Q3G72_020821 [Acer saccharum]
MLSNNHCHHHFHQCHLSTTATTIVTTTTSISATSTTTTATSTIAVITAATTATNAIITTTELGWWTFVAELEEARAILEGLKLTIERDFLSLNVELDALNVVNICNGVTSSICEIGS